MNQQQKPNTSNNRHDSKTTLSLLKWTTTIGAISLTLGGWGLLARAEAVNAAQSDQAQISSTSLALGAQAAVQQADASGLGTAAASGDAVALATTPKATSTASTASPTGANSTGAVSTGTVSTGTAASKASTVVLPTATPQPTSTPTAAPTSTATAAPTDTPTAVPTVAPTATPEVLYQLDIVQWTQNENGDPIAVVRDDSGVLWYVWGPDVERIEQGQQPQYSPVAVNSSSRSRGS